MSKAAGVLLMKYFMTFVLAAITFNLINLNGWGWVLAVSVTASTLNYLLGDFYVLPRFDYLVASAVNGVLAVLTAYIADFIIPGFKTSFKALIVFGILIAVGEFVIHRYLMRSREARP
ncbi:MAG: YndM family protein [Peptococcaceae bacterium]|nr:YndM family protein [Peptococcaceae bacterium]